MSRMDDGGPAFPVTAEQSPNGTFPEGGMTLLDYFAAKALMGNIACPDYDMSHTERARWAYSQARAMLKARDEVPR